MHASEVSKTQDNICFVAIPRPFIGYKYAKFISNKSGGVSVEQTKILSFKTTEARRGIALCRACRPEFRAAAERTNMRKDK